MKFNVAVVDDEPEVLENISELLQEYANNNGEDLSFDVETFSDGDEFLNGYPDGCEIIFFDINLPGKNGLSLAKEIRKRNKTAVIIFCTNYAQYAINGYEVNALGYILKPIEKTSFNRNLDRAIRVLKGSQSRRIRIKTVHGSEVVPVSDIVYLEIQIHNLYFYTMKEDGNLTDYRTRGSMQEMTDSLGELGFARCSACYLVNFRHVVSVKNGEVRMRGGVNLPISRKFTRSFYDSFIKYLGKNGTLNV